jgi:hypothetical protein
MFLVQEFVAGKWFTCRSFETETEAFEYGPRFRVWRVRHNGKTLPIKK